ncbi:Tetratricopeptide repeat protein 37, partial [Borealophlyctis nickersoniae]
MILRLAAGAYRVAIGVCASHAEGKEWQDLTAEYWHDLGCVCFYRSQIRHRRGVDEGGRKALVAMAVRCVGTALKRHPGSESFWNALGVYTLMEDARMSQHAFIRAVECNSRSPIPWTNLGYLYLLHNDLDLASQAFQKAQFVDPDWALGWLGQAFVAERMGGRKEAREVVEHAFELGGEVEFELAYTYAHHTYTHLLTSSTRDPSSFALASFCLLKFIERRSGDPAALNLFGLVLERQGRYQDAVGAFEGAIRGLEKLAGGGDVGRKLEMAVENRARCLVSSGRFGEASAAYSQLSSLRQQRGDSTLPADPYAEVGYGLSLFFEGRLRESLVAFERALQVLESRSGEVGTKVANDVGVLLSQVLYALGSVEHVELARAQLFQCIQKDPTYLKALIGLCALGLVREDATLAQSAAAELIKVCPADCGDGGDDADVDWVLSRLFLMQGNVKTAKGFLSKAVHRYPWKAERWARVAELVYR